MEKKFQIIMPIQGTSDFFPKADYFFPKPLVEVCGKPLIEVVLESFISTFPSAIFTFVVDKNLIRAFSFDQTLKQIVGANCNIIEKASETKGALCSVLLAADTVDWHTPTIIVNSDQKIDRGLKSTVQRFISSNTQAGTITFKSNHPRWSYIVESETGEFVQAFEKRVASQNAVAGLYFFENFSIFFHAASNVLRNDQHLNGEFFLSEVLNEVFLDGGTVLTRKISENDTHSFYSPKKIAEYERMMRTNSPYGELKDQQINIIIPAAGEGTRFKEKGWLKPKPFIDVGGEPMMEHVIKNVSPHNSRVTLIIRSEHASKEVETVQHLRQTGANIFELDALTEGTACTVLAAKNYIDPEMPLLIANSDQIVDFDVNKFVADCLNRDLHGSILVFKDEKRDPKWSFAKLNQNGLVNKVAEKEPISDLATVGIYLFSKGQYFLDSAIEMIVNQERVNGEYYTCPVYNYMIKKGLRVGSFSIPKAAMHGIGTPDDLLWFLENKLKTTSCDMPKLRSLDSNRSTDEKS